MRPLCQSYNHIQTHTHSLSLALRNTRSLRVKYCTSIPLWACFSLCHCMVSYGMAYFTLPLAVALYWVVKVWMDVWPSNEQKTSEFHFHLNRVNFHHHFLCLVLSRSLSLCNSHLSSSHNARVCVCLLMSFYIAKLCLYNNNILFFSPLAWNIWCVYISVVHIIHMHEYHKI